MRNILYARSYSGGMIEIPFHRLSSILSIGDVIHAHSKFNCSNEEYIITKIQSKYVWAVPDPEFIKKQLKFGVIKSIPNSYAHVKIKYVNISGIRFVGQEKRIEWIYGNKDNRNVNYLEYKINLHNEGLNNFQYIKRLCKEYKKKGGDIK